MNNNKQRIRVENQSGIVVSRYATPGEERPIAPARPFRILFVKPYQQSRNSVYGPPLGILTLVSILRERFGDLVEIELADMKLYHQAPEEILQHLKRFQPDVVAVSALNCEARASFQIAELTKHHNPDILTLIGGPFTLRQSQLIFSQSQFDWIFESAADRSLPEALRRHFSDQALGDDICGFSYRASNGNITYNGNQDLITNLDDIPIPAWDLVDFDRYSKRDRPRIITNIEQRKYAYLFTSRGCPYLCNYCHDIFTKRFVYNSVERVLEEIRILYEQYGVTELHIMDDIFNLHRPRVQEIMNEIYRRWPGVFYIAFPNGLRGDILDKPTIDAMVRAGTFHATISIETVTPRLQDLAEKYLDVPKANWAIEEFARQGVVIQGSFMLGFPSETPEEIEATIKYAIHSKLTQAHFFSVTPQPGTPIYDIALKESAAATHARAEDERDNGDYYSFSPWYSKAYDYDLQRKINMAFLRFYFHPRRALILPRLFPIEILWNGLKIVTRRLIQGGIARALDKLGKPNPETL